MCAIDTDDIKKSFEDIEHFLAYSFSCVHPSDEVDYIKYNLAEAKKAIEKLSKEINERTKCE